jgi:hypothetical protein
MVEPIRRNRTICLHGFNLSCSILSVCFSSGVAVGSALTSWALTDPTSENASAIAKRNPCIATLLFDPMFRTPAANS